MRLFSKFWLLISFEEFLTFKKSFLMFNVVLIEDDQDESNFIRRAAKAASGAVPGLLNLRLLQEALDYFGSAMKGYRDRPGSLWT